MGAIDGLMGSVEGKVSLALFGLVLAGGTLTFRWWQIQRHSPAAIANPVMLYFPEPRTPPLPPFPAADQTQSDEVDDKDD